MDEQSPLKRTLWLLLRISRVFGVAPVRFKGNKAYVSTPLSLYGFILFGAISTGYIYNLIVLPSDNSSLEFTKKPSKYRMIYLLLDLIVMAVGTLLGPQRMRVMIQVLAEIDKLQIKKTESTILSRIIRVIVYSIVPTIWTHSSIHYYRRGAQGTPLQYHIMKYILHTTTFLIMIHFVILASMINYIILHINDTLEDVLNALSNKIVASVSNRRFQTQTFNVPLKYINLAVDSIGQVTKRSMDTGDKLKPEAEKMRSLARTYVIFWSCTRRLNVSEHFALLMYLIAFVMHLAGSLLFFFDGTFDQDSNTVALWFLEMGEYCSMIIISATMLLLLVEPSQIMTTQIRRTRLLVGKVLNAAATDQRLIDSAERLEAQLQLGNPIYSAFGVFELGRPIITTVVGVVITYLLVILQ